MASMQVDVVSPEAIVWSGEASFVVARTVEGEIGILPGHEPLMAAVATGAVEIEPVNGERIRIGVHGGFLQIFDNSVTLLTDRATLVEGDTAAAHEAASALAAEEEGA
ncbi:MAG: F0F1 ATP synthase subunit epsilon [Acidimicrobiia bacterium]|nr:F0F1 ATP synthase subunit epsilon [Acidimicrobiia bacterium]